MGEDGEKSNRGSRTSKWWVRSRHVLGAYGNDDKGLQQLEKTFPL